MIAPRVQVYVQPTPYTIGQILRGSYITVSTAQGNLIHEYRAGEEVRIHAPRDGWPINVRVVLPGFNAFTCTLERYGGQHFILTGGNNEAV